MALRRSALPFLPHRAPAGDDSVALVWAEEPAADTSGPLATLTYGALREAVADRAEAWPAAPGGLALIALSAGPQAVIAYLAALAADQAVCLVDPSRPLDDVVARLAPEVIVTDAGTILRERQAPVHPDLALLLPTSGSTGSPRMVRLSAEALAANCDAIIQALGITAAERAVGHLPIWYSFGLSVLHTHLAAGASLLLTRRGPLEAPFWDLVARAEATGFPGVPFHYQVLRRMDLDRLGAHRLKTFTQAGGRLDPRLVAHTAKTCAARGARFFVMYGQTEAAPRIAVNPPEEVLRQPEAVGRALPGVTLRIRRDDGTEAPAGEAGEVEVQGANVMMGYAETRADLARGDEQGGVLRTGDLGVLDATGVLTLKGRRSRFAKLFGLRIDLEAAEQAAPAPTVAVEKGETLVLVTEGEPEAVRQAVLAATGLHPTAVVARPVDSLPRLPSGKPDLKAAEALA